MSITPTISTPPPHFLPAYRTSHAFTLLELVVVLGVLALLLCIGFPALSRAQPVNRTMQCLNNSRQLAHAWRMYTDDSRDQIVCASTDGSGISNPLNQYAWTQVHLDFNSVNRGNWDLTSLTNAPLWSYGPNPSIYHCPSDPSGLDINGVFRPFIRSVSMNLYLGGFAGTDGGWPSAGPFRIFFKTTDLSAPGPAKTFVFLDDQPPPGERWGNFMTDMAGYSPRTPSFYSFLDLPGYRHDGGCTFSFADSHVELKRWADPRTTPPPSFSAPSHYPTPNNPDVAWLQDHSTSLK